MHQINLFKIMNLSNLSCCYRLIEVTNLPRDRTHGKNVNLLAKRISYDLKQPVALLSGKEYTHLAIPALSELPELEQSLTPHVAVLQPLDEAYVLDFDKLDKQTLLVAKSFLRFAFQAPLMKDPQLWGNNRCYFWKHPLDMGEDDQGSEISISEGFVFNIVPLESNQICVSVDITHKYTDKRWLLDHVDKQDIHQYRMRHFLYHFGHRWYRIQLIDTTGLSIGEQKFQNERTGEMEHVYQYTKEQCYDNPPYWIRDLDRNTPAILYRYPGSKKKRYGAAALCKLMYATKEPAVSELHHMTILPPQERFRKIERVISKLFQNAVLDGTPIDLSREPLRTTAKVFSVPAQLFGHDTVLEVKKNGQSRGVHLSELGKTRTQYLLDDKIGPLTDSAFAAQYIVLPKSLPRAISTDLIERFQEAMEQFSQHPYRASPVIYEDKDCSSLYRQVNAVQSPLEKAEIHRGYLFLILPENAKPDLHHYLKREFWPNLQSQCAMASNIKRFYGKRERNGEVRYYVRGKTARRYSSYLQYAALGMLQVNRKWLWGLATPLHCDVYVGIDVLNHTAGFTFIYKNARYCYFRDYQSKQPEKLSARQIRSVISENLREDIRRLRIAPRSLAIHRDGRWYESESLGLKAAIDILRREAILPTDVKVGVVEIHKQSALGLRLVERYGRGYMNPQLGAWFPVSDNEGIVCNTGRPFNLQGTANPLHTVVVEGDLPIRFALEDIFALSQLIFSAPERCGRLPLTIRLADDLLEPIAAEVELDEAIYDDLEDEYTEVSEVLT